MDLEPETGRIVTGYGHRWNPAQLATWLDPKFQIFRSTQLMADKFVDLVTGRDPYQIWTWQPQIGKSTGASRTGPLWALDWYPDTRFIVDSYAVQLSAGHTRWVRDTISGNPEKLRVRLSRSERKAGKWKTTEGGGMLAVGVDGSVTGEPGDIIIADDPHKNFKESHSPTKREAVWRHWQGDLSTRMQEGTRALVCMTPWHPDDFRGRLLDEMAVPWSLLHVPAIADSNLTPDGDPLGRKDGEVVDPRRFRKSTMLDRKRIAGPYLFNAMYQGVPTLDQIGILQRRWFEYAPAMPRRHDMLFSYTSWDATFGDSGDSYVVGQCWLVTNNNPHRFYIIDSVRGNWDYGTTLEEMAAFARRHPYASRHVIENKANGPALASELAKGDAAGGRPAVSGVELSNPDWGAGEGKDGAKIGRAHIVSPLIRNGRVFVPGWIDRNTKWLVDFLDEVGNFPTGTNNDQVDALTQALHWGDIEAAASFSRNSWVDDELLFGRR